MSKEAMKLAVSVLKGSQEYKRGHTTFVEAVEELKEALVEQVEVCCGDYGKCMKPCTPQAQPAREWAGLTPEESVALFERHGHRTGELVGAVEDKLKEKNT